LSEAIDFVEVVRNVYRKWLEDQGGNAANDSLTEDQVATLATALWANRFDSTNEVFEKAVYEMVAIKVSTL
jgi:hypothetical protein